MSWPLVKLGEVAPSKALKNPVVVDDDNVWQLNLDMVESGSGRILKKLKAPLSEAGSSTHWFDDRHILYSKLRPYLNKVVLPDEEGLATTELVPMLPDPKRLDRRYLVHYLRSKQFVSWISDQVAGAKMPRVSMKVFWDHEIPLPPVEEQKRIAAILDKADAIRQKRKQAIDLADEFLRSVFLDMFGDPVTNPKGWEVTTCGEVFKLSSGKGLTAKNMDKDGSHLVYGGNGINGKHSEYMFEEPQLIIGRVGVYCGSIHITEKKSWVTDNAMYIKEYLKKVNIIFLAQLLDLANLNQYAGKAAQPLISGNRIYPLEMILPPIEEQERFAKIHRAFIENITKLHGGLESKSDLFQSLSQKAFSGQL
ncbi:restriction endonuclease subunit S [Vibrio sp. F12]|uniref:restriction endonuclease subunit S n=1 Tax=Vibrio sp. F12 TaxID=2070776 RepID=UPI0010BE00E6|nr:restriction endonuclease subunit S [Vibrio sp. F12]TKE94367.1 restriction endonuclease subunit S [Vibrio sp. F12]USN27393.1 restriction endonuclease subunit S [synthetic construct]